MDREEEHILVHSLIRPQKDFWELSDTISSCPGPGICSSCGLLPNAPFLANFISRDMRKRWQRYCDSWCVAFLTCVSGHTGSSRSGLAPRRGCDAAALIPPEAPPPSCLSHVGRGLLYCCHHAGPLPNMREMSLRLVVLPAAGSLGLPYIPENVWPFSL